MQAGAAAGASAGLWCWNEACGQEVFKHDAKICLRVTTASSAAACLLGVTQLQKKHVTRSLPRALVG